MLEPSSGFQLCTKTSTRPAPSHGCTTCSRIDSAQLRHRLSSPGTPFFMVAVRVVYVPTRP